MDSAEGVGSVALPRIALSSALQTNHRSAAAVAVAAGYYQILGNDEIRSDGETLMYSRPVCWGCCC